MEYIVILIMLSPIFMLPIHPLVSMWAIILPFIMIFGLKHIGRMD